MEFGNLKFLRLFIQWSGLLALFCCLAVEFGKPSLLIQNWNFFYESKPIIFIDEVWIFFYRVVFKVFAFPSIISPTVAILAPNGQTFLNIIHVPFIIVTFIRDGFRYSKIEFWVVHKIIPRIGWKRQVDQKVLV